MKKLASSLVILIASFFIALPSYANDANNDYSLVGETGTLNFLVLPTNFLSQAAVSNTVDDSNPNYVDVTSTSDIAIEFNLSDGQYFEKMSEMPTEENVILIKNSDARIVGVVGIPKVTLDSGDVIYGTNSIDGNKIVSSVASDFGTISTRIYIQRPFNFYFSDGNYGYRNYAEGYLGNFWMRPISYNFLGDEQGGLEVLAMSWDAVDAYFRTFSGSDYTKWVNNNNKLYNQYRCHYNFVSKSEEWNLEEWRPDVSYANVVLAGCNP